MRRLPLLFLLWLLAACTSEVSPDQPDPGRFVVEGWIDSGEAPVVMLTKAYTAQFQYEPVDNLRSHLIAGAEVLVEDELGNEVRLDFRHDKHYFPPYIYTTDRMRGVPGCRYRLKVRYQNRFVSGETRIPHPVALEGIDVRPLGGSDTLRGIWARFPQPPDEDTFYRFFVRVEGRDSTFLPALVSGVERDGTTTTLPVMQGRSLFNTSPGKPLWFNKGDTVHLKFCTLDRKAWEFWSSYDEVNSLGRNPFFPVSWNIPSQLEGAYGYWAGYGTTRYTVQVE